MSDQKRRKREMTREEAEQMVTQLIEEENFEEALGVCRYIADELQEDPKRIGTVLNHVGLVVQQLRAEDSGSSWWLLGEMYRLGRGGMQRDHAGAYRCFERAAERGHLFALWRQGLLLQCGHGVARNREEGFRLMLRAAEQGCAAAYYYVGLSFEWGRGVERNRRKAAQWYLRAGSRFSAASRLRSLLKHHPLQCAPLGEWEPRWHALAPLQIHEAMRETMLLGKRMRLPHGVALMVAEYVCTEGEEWERTIEEEGSAGSSSEIE